MPDHTAAANLADAVATVHGWPRGDHRALCLCEKHKPGESTCQCKSCEMVREGRCTICGQLPEAEAERETVRRITARLRVDAEECHGLGKYMAADTLFKAADAIDREFGSEDKGGEPR